MRRPFILLFVLMVLIIGGGGFLLVTRSGGGGGNLPFGPGRAETTPTATTEPRVGVVEARIEIQAGTFITNTELFGLGIRQIPQRDLDTETMFTNLSDVQNKVAVRSIPPGIVRREDFTEPGLSQNIPTPGPDEAVRAKAYPLQVDNLSGVADQVRPGDFVDVVATLLTQRRVYVPTALEENIIRFTVEQESFLTTKTIVQNAEVLRILRPARRVAAEGTPEAGDEVQAEGEPGRGSPQTDESGRPAGTQGQDNAGETITQGSWTLVLALTDQEAELIEFAQASRQFAGGENNATRLSLVLRGSGDRQAETTAGASMDIVINQIGLPLPEPMPAAPLNGSPIQIVP